MQPTITTRYHAQDTSSGFGQWQVVFKIEHDGKLLDYCREQPPRNVTHDDWEGKHKTAQEVTQWATDMCIRHKLDGAEIQWF